MLANYLKNKEGCIESLEDISIVGKYEAEYGYVYKVRDVEMFTASLIIEDDCNVEFDCGQKLNLLMVTYKDGAIFVSIY